MRSKQQTLVHPEENPRQSQLSSPGNLQLSNHLQNLVHASKELSTVKTRPTTPVLANDGGGSFWLATVASTPAGLPPHGTHHPAMDPTCGSAETGFINSQPSMAEFMTALPQLAGDSSLQHSPGTGGSISPGAHHPAYHAMMDPHGVADPSGVNVPEYPWMKEKKTTRKSNQQGKSSKLFSCINYRITLALAKEGDSFRNIIKTWKKRNLSLNYHRYKDNALNVIHLLKNYCTNYFLLFIMINNF